MRKRLMLVATISASLVLGGATPALASANGEESGEVLAFVETKSGEHIRLDDAVDTNLGLEEPSHPDGSTVSPQLISFDQWFRCFSLNQQEEVFREYAFYPDNGDWQDVRLRCGYHDAATDKGFGYKHIRARHEGDWQAKYDAARNAGWDADLQGLESWDDLMHAGVGESITFPLYSSGIKGNNQRCVVGGLVFKNVRTQQIVYSMRVTASFAYGSDRLISAYPTSATFC